MSVLTLGPNALNYIAAGIEKAAYNTTVNEFYFDVIRSHFRDKDTEVECLRLVRSWSDLNMKSYCLKYKDEFESLAPFINLDTNKPLNAVQLLKYVECLSYNIEPEHWELSEQEKADLKILNKLQASISSAIIGSMKEYKTAEWCD